LGATAVRAAVDGARPSDAAALPIVHATMHLAYGCGVLVGTGRHGVPGPAVASAVRRLAP
jgi:hypothetical protein